LYLSIIAICVGASLGALLRWWLAIRLNELLPALPIGTLTANLVGGYIIGVAASYLAGHPALPVKWRLFVITGFLGGLTTFSTFSAEVALHLVEGRIQWSLATIAAHVIGSVVMTLLGIATVSVLRTQLSSH
jgi:CrcB protein